MDCKANQDTGIHFEASGWPAGRQAWKWQTIVELPCKTTPKQHLPPSQVEFRLYYALVHSSNGKLNR